VPKCGEGQEEGKGLCDGCSFAFRTLLGEGYDQMVLINSDSPALPPSQVREAFDALSHADLVLGPSDDGGYNLIAMSQPHIGVFERITWSTDIVARETLERAAELGLRVHVLPTSYDIDAMADLQRLAREVIADPNHPAVETRRKLRAWVKAGVFDVEAS